MRRPCDYVVQHAVYMRLLDAPPVAGQTFCYCSPPSGTSMPRHPGTRSSQPSTSHGIGQHFTSPRKARNRVKEATPVIIPGRARRRELLLNRLQVLLSQRGPNPSLRTPSPPLAASAEQAEPSAFAETFSADFDIAADHATAEVEPDQPPSRPARRIAQANQYDKWKTTIPTLIEPFLIYLEQTLGKAVPQPAATLSCCQAACETKKTELVALFYDCKRSISLYIILQQ